MSSVDNTFMARRQEQLETDDDGFGELMNFSPEDEELVTRDEETGVYTFEIKDPEAIQEAMRMMLDGEILPMTCSEEWTIDPNGDTVA